MKNKQAFSTDEANNWFQRNIGNIEKNESDNAIKLLCEWLKPFSEKINKVAEIGCSSGHRLAQICTSLNAEGSGVEPSQDAIEYATKNFPQHNFHQGFGDSIPLASTNFDLVHLGFFLYLVDRSDYLKCISEADRILQDGGFVSIIDFDTASPYANNYSHSDGLRSFKCDNAKTFLASGRYYLVNKYSFSNSQFYFSENEDDRVSLTLLYNEKNAFDLK